MYPDDDPWRHPRGNRVTTTEFPRVRVRVRVHECGCGGVVVGVSVDLGTDDLGIDDLGIDDMGVGVDDGYRDSPDDADQVRDRGRQRPRRRRTP